MLQKIEKYRRTVERLREALSDFTQNPNSTKPLDPNGFSIG